LFGIESFADTTMKAGKLSSTTIYFYACVDVICRRTVKFRQLDPKQNETISTSKESHVYINRAAKLGMVILFQTEESACKMSKISPALGTRFTV